jgi:Na+-translocating ferredoxin:NAD+ oxidoreductase RnfD subunit
MATRALSLHYASGRLSLDDLTARLEAVLGASRRREIVSTLRDLPPTWRDGDELQRLGRSAKAAVKRGVFLGVVAVGWWTINLILLIAFLVAAAADVITPLELALLPAAWLATTFLAWRVARHR